jgi:hypothetical protein
MWSDFKCKVQNKSYGIIGPIVRNHHFNHGLMGYPRVANDFKSKDMANIHVKS